MDVGLIVITAFLPPFRGKPEIAGEVIAPDSSVDVYVSAPREVRDQRDVKGRYKKARVGQLPNMSGFGAKYNSLKTPRNMLNMQYVTTRRKRDQAGKEVP